MASSALDMHPSGGGLAPFMTNTKNGRLKMLANNEKALVLKKRMYGAESPVVEEACREVVQACNAMAMDNLAGGDLVNALVMLQRAESWTDPDIFMRHDGMRVLTYNNYACYYKREGNLKLALRYLRKAAALGTESSGIDNLSVTYLNLCAVLSQMGKHRQAMEHAQSAVFHCQEELMRAQSQPDFTQRAKAEKMITLAIAYHNLAVELEHTGRQDMCLQWYKKALVIAQKYGRDNVALVTMFNKSYTAAAVQIRKARMQRRNNPLETASMSRLHHGKHSARGKPKSAYNSHTGGIGPSSLPGHAKAAARRRRQRPTSAQSDAAAIDRRVAELQAILGASASAAVAADVEAGVSVGTLSMTEPADAEAARFDASLTHPHEDLLVHSYRQVQQGPAVGASAHDGVGASAGAGAGAAASSTSPTASAAAQQHQQQQQQQHQQQYHHRPYRRSSHSGTEGSGTDRALPPRSGRAAVPRPASARTRRAPPTYHGPSEGNPGGRGKRVRPASASRALSSVSSSGGYGDGYGNGSHAGGGGGGPSDGSAGEERSSPRASGALQELGVITDDESEEHEIEAAVRHYTHHRSKSPASRDRSLRHTTSARQRQHVRDRHRSGGRAPKPPEPPSPANRRTRTSRSSKRRAASGAAPRHSRASSSASTRSGSRRTTSNSKRRSGKRTAPAPAPPKASSSRASHKSTGSPRRNRYDRAAKAASARIESRGATKGHRQAGRRRAAGAGAAAAVEAGSAENEHHPSHNGHHQHHHNHHHHHAHSVHSSDAAMSLGSGTLSERTADDENADGEGDGEGGGVITSRVSYDMVSKKAWARLHPSASATSATLHSTTSAPQPPAAATDGANGTLESHQQYMLLQHQQQQQAQFQQQQMQHAHYGQQSQQMYAPQEHTDSQMFPRHEARHEAALQLARREHGAAVAVQSTYRGHRARIQVGKRRRHRQERAAVEARLAELQRQHRERELAQQPAPPEPTAPPAPVAPAPAPASPTPAAMENGDATPTPTKHQPQRRRRGRRRRGRGGINRARSPSPASVASGAASVPPPASDGGFDKVDAWLNKVGLGHHAPAFRREGMDVAALEAARDELPELDNVLLVALGLTRVGDRLKFKRALATFGVQLPPPDAAPPVASVPPAPAPVVEAPAPTPAPPAPTPVMPPNVEQQNQQAAPSPQHGSRSSSTSPSRKRPSRASGASAASAASASSSAGVGSETAESNRKRWRSPVPVEVVPESSPRSPGPSKNQNQNRVLHHSASTGSLLDTGANTTLALHEEDAARRVQALFRGHFARSVQAGNVVAPPRPSPRSLCSHTAHMAGDDWRVSMQGSMWEGVEVAAVNLRSGATATLELTMAEVVSAVCARHPPMDHDEFVSALNTLVERLTVVSEGDGVYSLRALARDPSHTQGSWGGKGTGLLGSARQQLYQCAATISDRLHVITLLEGSSGHATRAPRLRRTASARSVASASAAAGDAGTQGSSAAAAAAAALKPGSPRLPGTGGFLIIAHEVGSGVQRSAVVPHDDVVAACGPVLAKQLKTIQNHSVAARIFNALHSTLRLEPGMDGDRLVVDVKAAAVLTIQAHVRGHNTRRRLRQAEQSGAAVRIQSVVRGKAARRAANRRRHLGAPVYAGGGISHRGRHRRHNSSPRRSHPGAQHVEQDLAATKIQAVTRGVAVRRRRPRSSAASVPALDSPRSANDGEGSDADVASTSSAPSLHGQHNIGAQDGAAEVDDADADTVQSTESRAATASEGGGSVAGVELDRNQAAARIQATARGRRDRALLEQQAEAATRMQSLFRGHSARALMAQQRGAATQLQSMARGFAARREVAGVRARAEAATCIQAGARGWRQRRSFRGSKAALRIQRVWRGHCGRRRAVSVRRQRVMEFMVAARIDLSASVIARFMQRSTERRRRQARRAARRSARVSGGSSIGVGASTTIAARHSAATSMGSDEATLPPTPLVHAGGLVQQYQ